MQALSAQQTPRLEIAELVGEVFSTGVVTAIVIYALLVLQAGCSASEKGRSPTGFMVLSILLTPAIGLPVALLVAENKEYMDQLRLKNGIGFNCPECREVIKVHATKCRYCGSKTVNRDE